MKMQKTPELPPGTIVGDLEVEALVGVGGYGVVYRARHLESGILSALKFIPLESAREWASREFGALVRLWHHHPNLVELWGSGHWPTNKHEWLWLQLAFIEGKPLDVWVREHNPDALELAGKVLGVGRALAVVHAAEVVHRDVKESNVLVRQSDGEAVLVDFGAGSYPHASPATQGVFPPGTPDYRSPEAWLYARQHGHEQGARYRARPADDLYAVGVMLYRQLTRRLPFMVTDEESVQAIIHQRPVPPHIVNPRVPPALSALCMKLLEKKPEERLADAVALCAELETLMAHADDSWRVRLLAEPRPDAGPRAEVREEATRPTEKNAGAPAPEQQIPAQPTPQPTTKAARPEGSQRPETLRHVAMWAAVVVGLVLAGWWLARAGSPEPEGSPTPSPVTLAPAPPTPEAPAGQEVAPARTPPEAERAAVPPPVESTPAAAASPAAPSKDNTSVKTQQKNPDALGNTKHEGWRRAARNVCAGLAGAALQACLATQQPAAPVRSDPPIEECPAGAAETMHTLHLDTVEGHTAFLLKSEETKPRPVREGKVSIHLPAREGKLPGGTVLLGRLYVGRDRVFFRLTEARTPTGETYTVCMELFDGEMRGMPFEEGSTADRPLIAGIGNVQAMRRFGVDEPAFRFR